MKNQHGVPVDERKSTRKKDNEFVLDAVRRGDYKALWGEIGERVLRDIVRAMMTDDITEHYQKEPELEVVSDDRGNVYRGPVGTDYLKDTTLEHFVCNLSEFLPGGPHDPDTTKTIPKEQYEKLIEVARMLVDDEKKMKQMFRGTAVCVPFVIADLAREALGES